MLPPINSLMEILTLLVCIVIFAPLSNAASNIFIFTIALTALLLLLIPLILTFISGFKGDKAEHEIKRDKERQAAVVSGNLVLETDPIRRKQYLRLPKLLVLAVCPGFFSDIFCGQRIITGYHYRLHTHLTQTFKTFLDTRFDDIL